MFDPSGPPVLDPPMSFFESSSIRVSEESRFLGLTARPPLAKNRYKRPALGLLSRPGGLFSATPLAFCALGVHFQRPLSHSVLRSVKNTWESAPLRFLRHLAPHVGHLARLVGHLGANMSHKCSQDTRKMPSWSQHRQKSASATSSRHPKIPKNLCFPYVFVGFSAIQPMGQNSPKMLPTCSQNLPS